MTAPYVNLDAKTWASSHIRLQSTYYNL